MDVFNSNCKDVDMEQQVNNPNPDNQAELDLDGLDALDLDDAGGDAPNAGPDGDGALASLDYDDSEIPENLRPLWEKHTKGYQKAFTQKTQAIAEIRKDLERRLGDSQDYAYKAAQLDQVLSIPGVRDAIMRALSDEGGTVGGEAGQAEGTQPRQVSPEQQRIDRLEAQLRQQQNSQRQAEIIRQAEEFKAQNPDWTKYQDGMQAAWKRNPNLHPTEAYTIAKHEAWNRQLKEARAKRPPKEAPPVEAEGRLRSSEPTGKMSFQEAFERAERDTGTRLSR